MPGDVDLDAPTPCWCGEPDPLYDWEGLDETCGGTGTLHCYCGGDMCVCHHHGEIDCPGCDECCADGEDEDLEDYDDAG